MAKWTLIVRVDSSVSRRGFDQLDDAIAAAEAATDEALRDGPMGKVRAFRNYEPGQLVKARIEISGKGLIFPPTAGLDIQGDGGMQPFTGGVRRKPLEANTRKQAFYAIRKALEP